MSFVTLVLHVNNLKRVIKYLNSSLVYPIATKVYLYIFNRQLKHSKSKVYKEKENQFLPSPQIVRHSLNKNLLNPLPGHGYSKKN